MDIEAELLWIGAKPISGCIGCGKCGNAGMCVFNDQVNEIHKRMDEFQGLIIGSPVYYGGPSGQIKCFLDRLFQSSLFEWKGKLGAAVVSCRRGGASMAFQSLNMYFTIPNMQAVGSQYWNQVHGFTPEDVEKDEEGLQNMAWLLKCLDAGRRRGIPMPVRFPEADIWGVVMPDDCALALNGSIGVEDLIGIPLFCSEQGWNKDISRWCGSRMEELHLKGSFRLSYNASLFVKEKLGYLLTFDRLIDTGPDSGLIFRPLFPKLETKMYLIWKKYQIFTPLTERLLNSLREKM